MRCCLSTNIAITCILIALAAVAHAQNVQVVVSAEKLSFFDGKTIQLERYYGGGYQAMPNTFTKGKNAYSTTIVNVSRGLYRLNISSLPAIDCVIGKDDTLYIKINESKMGIAVQGLENEAYLQYNMLLNQRRDELGRFDDARLRISLVDPQYYHKKNKAKMDADSVREVYNEKLKAFSKQYYPAYAARILAPLSRIPSRYSIAGGYDMFDNHHAYYHRHYMDNVPFREESILNHPNFAAMLGFYLENYSGEFAEDNQRAINYLMNKNAIGPVREYMQTEMLKYFYKHDNTVAVKYLLDNYMDGCTSEGEMKTVIDAITNSPLYVGSTLPALTVGQYASTDTMQLGSVLSKQKRNVIIFWRADCTHCQEVLSILARGTYKSDVQITTILLSTSANPPFANQLLSNPAFANYHCAGKLAELQKAYKIYKTPFIIEADSKGAIVAKYNSYNEIPF